MQGAPITPEILFKPGDVIAGKYEIIRIIGEGGMGIVVEAVHQALDQRVAIKFHRPQASANQESIARFLREARAAAQIRSEHIARVSDVATLDGGDPYFVMEFLDGQDLDSVLEADGPLTIPVALDYTLQVCEALAEAHALGIVHRDLKPANLFLAQRGDGTTVVKLLDFGISKTLPRGDDAELNMTKTRALMGSPLYMAPEQMRSTKRVDHRADIWSLGVLMHEMLTGDTPFVGETLPEVCASIAADEPIALTTMRADASFELESVILRCLQKDPEHRYADVADLITALAPVLPAEAASSIARIVRVLRGQGTMRPPVTSIRPPTSVSMRGSRPSLSAVGAAGALSNAETLFVESSDPRRSGVAAKLRIRASSSNREAAETLTAETSLSSELPRSAAPGWRTNAVVGSVAFLAATAVLAWIVRLPVPRTRWHVPASASHANAESSASGAATSERSEPIAEPVTIEFVDVPAEPGSRVVAGGSRATYASHAPSKLLANTDHVDGGVKPVLRTPGNGAASTPTPSGTAAFGSARD
jgi:serine/threonine-protein kinase